MASADWEFVFDGVVGFLTSPIWQIPVMNFIEKNCIVFDPSEENCLPWSDIQKDYKKLVEDLLSSYLKDVGILEEQFVQACKSSSVQERPQMQAVFEQIWAAEDFEIFKRMMVQRNIELELQALQLIQHQQKQRLLQQQQQQPPQQKEKPKEVAKMTQPKQQVVSEMIDDAILKEVLERSKKEYEASQKEQCLDTAEMDKHWAETHEENVKILKEKAEEKRSEMKKVVDDRIKTTDEEEKEEKTVEKAPLAHEKEMPKQKQTEAPKEASPKKEIHLPAEKPKTAAEAASSWLMSAKAEASSKESSRTPASGPSQDDDVKKREQYLKEQRDKLLQLKSKEREQQLDTYAKSQPKRPTSARVARQSFACAAEKKDEEETEPKKLAMRKALADRLKKEVIYK
ncbi:cilia- and flagella-associated protein 36-like [Rhopilema esculentum]|uniref:cilia- and flagella-associated protein 36-like n=1 Tax=Rhopilema esculentum TaxID=499914 RepID=UPI0031D445A0